MAIFGTEFEDVLLGTARGELIRGFGGQDYIEAGGGNDHVSGGNDSDGISGGDGADRIFGDAGDDYLQGDAGNDTLVGGLDDDGLFGGTGRDFLVAGAGNDTLQDDDDARMYGGGGDDWLYGNRGYADGGPGDDHIQTSGSGGGNVTLHGGTGADQFQMEFEIQDGHARHVTISDFNQADGDLLYMGTIANLPDGLYFGDQAATFAAFDTNHDGQITGLQADGSGDLYSREVGGNLTMSNWEDSLTINGTNHVDFSMLLGA